MARNYSSTAVDTILSAGISAAATTMTVAATTGLPSTPFTLAVDAGSATQELVLVTAVAGTTLTVTRGYDSTVAVSHDAGAVVRHSHAAIDFREAGQTKDAYDAHAAATVAHGATGAVVGTTNAQTLTNKTFDSTSPTAFIPPGVIWEYGGSAAPAGWLLADGSAVSRTTYANLFAVYGTTYGAGDGSTTFNLPNRKGRVGVGRDAAQTEFDTLGETGGAKTHALTTAEMPSHSHNADGTLQTAAPSVLALPKGGNYFPGSYNDYLPSAGFTAVDGWDIYANLDIIGNTSSTGGGGAHNNLQPYVVVNYIIKT